MSCPSEETWLLAELGEVTVNTRAAMLSHQQTCAACRARKASQQRLLEDLAAEPPLLASADDFVSKVMASCNAAGAAVATTPRARMTRRVLPWATGLLAAAAALLLVFLPRRDQDLSEQLQARGGKVTSSAAIGAASADVYLARGKTLQRLGDAALRSGDRLALRTVNQTASARFFMAFAIDAAGDVHWLFPAYNDAGENPEALELNAHQVARVLPETVELVDPAEGKLRVVSMLSERRLNVKEVEGRLRSLPAAPLDRVFPESTLREWTCMWRAR